MKCPREIVVNLTSEWLRSRPADDIHRPYVEQFGVLPLTSDMGGFYGLTTSGEVVEFVWDEPMHPSDVLDPRQLNIALFQGSRHYPELNAIVPERPAYAQTCDSCKGTGRVEVEAPEHLRDVFVCYCGGAGWLPPGVPQMPRTSTAVAPQRRWWQFWRR